MTTEMEKGGIEAQKWQLVSKFCLKKKKHLPDMEWKKVLLLLLIFQMGKLSSKELLHFLWVTPLTSGRAWIPIRLV